MKVPLNWLKEYVEIDESPQTLADALTMTGTKVESVTQMGEGISGVVTGKVSEIWKHPNADKLYVSRVDIGSRVIQVVTGAQNVKEGDCIPVATDGALLPGGKKISKGTLRGLESEGMMCSIQELGVTKDDYPNASEDGIFILEGDPAPGIDIKEYLGLDDVVFEFEITPNRPDCLSVLGIAREAAAALKKPLQKPAIAVKAVEASCGNDADDCGFAGIEVKDAELCPRYTARIIKDVKIGPSPEWMQKRLKAAGMRPINNIVDITNYVMLELGQPMHAFDLDLLRDRKIIVRRAAAGEAIETLDGQQRNLDRDMLVIADGKGPVAVAGVMGGANSEIAPSTNTILFESANFNGVSVRSTSKKLGMRTEASSRFEKGLDPENTSVAADRAAQLVELTGAGKVCGGIIDCRTPYCGDRTMKFRPDAVNALLGTSVSRDEMAEILKRLEFDVDIDAEGNCVTATIPSFRRDVSREADIAEEIARFHGYNAIVPTLLEGKASTAGRKTHKQKTEETIRSAMLSCGLSEIYTYSFTSPDVFDKIGMSPDDPLRRAIRISNPLGEDYSIMRTVSIPEMLEVLGRNYSRDATQAGLFELAYVYLPSPAGTGGDELPEQKMMLTVGMFGDAVDFYTLKGVFEELFDALGIGMQDYKFVAEKDNNSFHPGRCSKVMIRGQNAGVMGEVHPAASQVYGCPERTYIAAVDADTLIRYASPSRSYRQLPKYPAVTRDIALVMPESVEVGGIMESAKDSSGDILENISLFDIYRGQQIAAGMKSAAFTLKFRAGDRTLKDEEVNLVMKKILDILYSKYGAKLRE